jgi:hypothetical protein
MRIECWRKPSHINRLGLGSGGTRVALVATTTRGTRPEFSQRFMATSGHSERERILTLIAERATTDADFRRRLLADAAPTIESDLGIRLPPKFKIRFIEKDPGLDALIVLPDLARAGNELSDDDLDAVAGGTGECGPITWTW